QYWPAHYIFDARGQLRYTAFGEGDYSRQEQVIQQLLQESKA
ncbi:cytochrome c biogenesis protein DipZ, partial [Klebsiella pneumoniae]|nr:cytochrome c biogenesis protein DipZ [Klebsiella pneumoniae]